MTNHEKFTIETMGAITGPEQLKLLQADMRRLPNFSGRGFCATKLAHRDFWAVLKDKKTGARYSYFGTRDSFNAWGQQEAISKSTADAEIMRMSCWVCGDNPTRNPRCELMRVNTGPVYRWECQKCHEGAMAAVSAAPSVQ